ncbi:homocysteine S-methyltransferase family protein [Natronospora cellulosivora (SeqCode)]
MSKLLKKIENSVLIADGAMGTMIQKKDKSSKVPEEIMLENPQIIQEIHQEYIEAGSDLIETNTFGGSRLKLETSGLAEKTEEINKKAVELAKKAVNKTGKDVYILGSVGPTGKLMKPYGKLAFDDAYKVFKEQISYLVEAGVDGICIETMSDLAEMRAAVIAAKEFKVPIIAQMTFTENGYTLTGSTPEVVAIVLDSLAVDFIGVNCVAGFEEAISILEKMSKVTNKALSVFPNAGMPISVDGKTVFPQSANEYVEQFEALLDYNIKIIGGCCGTAPEYISALQEELFKHSSKFADNEVLIKKDLDESRVFLAGTRNFLELSQSTPVKIIGEKLNPTGRSDLKKALKEKDWAYLRKVARDQIEAGASLVDVNIGMAGIDKKQVMKNLIQELQMEIHIPLVLDSNDPEVLEAGLKEYQGKALVNSVNGEKESMDAIFPLIKKYGAAVIGLTLDDNGIPSTVEGRVAIAERIVNEANNYGIEVKNIFIDTLTLTAGSNAAELMVTLESLKEVREKFKVKTTLGASNVSHGLPVRELINDVFLSMAMGYGLDLPIADPFAEGIHDQIKTANLLTNRDKEGEEFIKSFAGREVVKKAKLVSKKGSEEESKDKKQEGISKEESKGGEIEKKNENVGEHEFIDKDPLLLEIRQAIIEGNRGDIVSLSESSIEKYKPQEIVNNVLIPSIQQVGDLYDTGRYFLPQLLKSAETMQKAFDFLKEKMLDDEKDNYKAKVLMATVKGDIHDIGKNIAKTIFMNHAYQVIDLGANVDSEEIVSRALEEEVEFVGLSALMTTTMMEMKVVIDKLKVKGYKGAVIIGGAVTNQDFADEIAADIYARDALDGVRKANKLLEEKVEVLS